MAFIVIKPKNALTAEQVKQLSVGATVTLHGCDRSGCNTQLECTIVQSGRKKLLRYVQKYPFEVKTKPIQNYPNKYYTEGGADW